ncbi:sodium- and chloride-dependent glycine transporter 2-like [Macrobrachium nipponense]|uniref:sodium- and chloride-dependent glycine transporter 2-like n=1 Tax=Macrobrachium nipponense TaxID=159736 RepID=UPI0030C85C63
MDNQAATAQSPVEGKICSERDSDQEVERGTWGNKAEFLLSLLGFAVGYGNIWRFPYLCYKNGGATFLIPYITMLFCAGLPLFFMELAIGQYISLGPNILFQKMAPILSGVGWGMVITSLLTALYFNVIISWSLYYTVASFASVLPWSHCSNDYNSLECYSEEEALVCQNNSLFFYNKTCLTADQYCGVANLRAHNLTHCHHPTEGALAASSVINKISPSEDFFLNRMLHVTGKTWDDLGVLQWELVGYLALSWILVGASLFKGIKSLGKVVYFTATFPYLILIVLFIRGLTLEGSYKGIEFYILKFDVTRLMEVEVWGDAAVQIFYSAGICFGSLITLSSYNKFNNNCMRHAFIVCLGNSCTSIFTGFVIFSILGFLAHELSVQVEDVVSAGSGLVFVVYPAALARLPIPQLWSVLFFFMVINVGLSSQFSMVETVTTALFDQFEFLRPKKPFVVALSCFGMFLLGLPFCLEGGILIFELFFWYSASFSVIALAITEVLGIHMIYGYRNFLRNIKEMDITLPFPVRCYWTITWLFTAPVSLVIIGVTSVYFFVPAYWGNYVFPQNIQTLGWCLSACSMGFIPLGAIYACCRTKTFMDVFKPSPEFCPASERELLRAGTCKESEGFRYTYHNEGFNDGNADHLKVTEIRKE